MAPTTASNALASNALASNALDQATAIDGVIAGRFYLLRGMLSGAEFRVTSNYRTPAKGVERTSEKMSEKSDGVDHARHASQRPRIVRLRRSGRATIGGFTLTELLVVITIIIILAGLTLPAFITTSDRAVQSASNAIGSILAAGRARALEQQTYVAIDVSERGTVGYREYSRRFKDVGQIGVRDPLGPGEVPPPPAAEFSPTGYLDSYWAPARGFESVSLPPGVIMVHGTQPISVDGDEPAPNRYIRTRFCFVFDAGGSLRTMTIPQPYDRLEGGNREGYSAPSATSVMIGSPSDLEALPSDRDEWASTLRRTMRTIHFARYTGSPIQNIYHDPEQSEFEGRFD